MLAHRGQDGAQISERDGDSEFRARELSPERQSLAQRLLGFISLTKLRINQADRGQQFGLDFRLICEVLAHVLRRLVQNLLQHRRVPALRDRGTNALEHVLEKPCYLLALS